MADAAGSSTCLSARCLVRLIASRVAALVRRLERLSPVRGSGSVAAALRSALQLRWRRKACSSMGSCSLVMAMETCLGRTSFNPYLARQMSDLWVSMDLSSSTGLKASLTMRSLRKTSGARKEHTQGLPRLRPPLRCKTLLLLVWLYHGY